MLGSLPPSDAVNIVYVCQYTIPKALAVQKIQAYIETLDSTSATNKITYFRDVIKLLD